MAHNCDWNPDRRCAWLPEMESLRPESRRATRDCEGCGAKRTLPRVVFYVALVHLHAAALEASSNGRTLSVKRQTKVAVQGSQFVAFTAKCWNQD